MYFKPRNHNSYEINNNNISALYLANDDTNFGVNDKITSSGNIFNDTNTKKCIKKLGFVVDSTVTAIK